MPNVLDTLRDRGFVEQTTHDQELYDYLQNDSVTCYIGFDPTAASLHVGSLVPIMALAHMQRNGHRPIALVGGGTAMVGDPSGKTEMRKMLTIEQIEANAEGIKRQLAQVLEFAEDKAVLVNNADWLSQLSYIPFLRDIGRHFSVNRMIKAESCRARMESEDGLSFIEFNYMLLQSYDFYELWRSRQCRMQMGGSDQWGNIVAGIELIRRMDGPTAFGVTFPLITTSSGAKMGKTAAGAVWLDGQLTSPYDYYQFWINTDDPDVVRFLKLFTFLPLEEIVAVEALEGADLNSAKAVLAFEATAIVHGRQEAGKAHDAAGRMFGIRQLPGHILASSSLHGWRLSAEDDAVPCTYMEPDRFQEGIPAFKLFMQVGLTKTGGEARRLINQGGGYINGTRLDSAEQEITSNDFNDMEITLRAGKKRFHKIVLGGQESN
jgi:tyrosyl-tRNA synthetase